MLPLAPLNNVLKDEIQEGDDLPVDQHPIDDKSLPSYQDEDYKEVLADLLTMRELYKGQSSWMQGGKVTCMDVAKKYLPQEQKETPDEYQNRLIRSPFENFVEPAVAGFAGLMSGVQLGKEVHQSIIDNQTNVDRQGNNMQTFWTIADSFALRDGMVAVLTEYPSAPKDETGSIVKETYEDQVKREAKNRPYFCLVERIDIISCDAEYSDGKLEIEQITIREQHKIKDGRFGKKTVTRYRVFTPGYYELWAIVKGAEGKPEGKIIEQGEVLAKGKPIPVPISFYSTADINPLEAPVPMLNLASLNIRHFQSCSDYYEVLRKCCLPVPVREGLVVEGQRDFKDLPPVVIGPNSVIDIPKGGNFRFAEPSGSAIASARTAILDLESSILRRTLAFLGNSDNTKTATESTLRSSQSQSLVMNLAIRKESAMETCFDLWAQYEGVDKGGRPAVPKDILIEVMQAQLISALSALVNAGQLSLRTFLQCLIDGRILQRDTDIDKEIAEIQQQKQENLAMTLQATVDQQRAMNEVQMQAESDEDQSGDGESEDGEENGLLTYEFTKGEFLAPHLRP